MNGWTGTVLRIDMGARAARPLPVEQSLLRFIGGRGLASHIYWDEVSPKMKAFDPLNPLCFMTGPLCGSPAPGSSRWVVVGKSPMACPEQYASGNLGGHLGAALKWAGLDGLIITGASAEPLVLVIGENGSCLFEDASYLWGKDALETIDAVQKKYGPKAHVATIGKAGEMRVRYATIIGSGGVCATKGFGAVMGAKRLKAVVVTANKKPVSVARPEVLRDVVSEIRTLWKGEHSERYWNDLILEDVTKVSSSFCYACPGVCRRGLYRNRQGESGYRKSCVSAYYYSMHEKDLTGKMGELSFFATQLANRHGLCILELLTLNSWIPSAIRGGVINPEGTGLCLAELGSASWIQHLVSLIIERNGIGDIIAEGSRRAVAQLGCDRLLEGCQTKAGFPADIYNPRLFLTTAPLYATEPVFPITQLHGVSFPMVRWMIWMGTEGMMGSIDTEKLRTVARLFWGDVRAAEFDSPEAIGRAAVIIQNRAYAKENGVLCDWFWPVDFTGNVSSGAGDPSLEARLISSVTGIDMDADGFLKTGELCANLYRAIYLREGRRGRCDDILEEFNFSSPLQEQTPPIGLFNPDLMLPGKDGVLFSRKGLTVDRNEFNTVMDDYYNERGWDVSTGLFTRCGLEKLGLKEVIREMDARGFVTG